MIGSIIIGLFGYGLAIYLGVCGAYGICRQEGATDYDVPVGISLLVIGAFVAAGTRALL
jgi:hypothetical protein